MARRRKRIRPEINMIPLIDVMMCLLAIFMITAPLMTSGIPLQLPRGDGKNIEGDAKTLRNRPRKQFCLVEAPFALLCFMQWDGDDIINARNILSAANFRP